MSGHRYMTANQRYWHNVIVNDDGCWGWAGSLDRYGYPIMKSEHGRRAHRYSWGLHFGDISAGMFVCHTCDNPICTRPDHLFIGTPGDNTRDAIAKGRAPQFGARRPCYAHGSDHHWFGRGDQKRGHKNGRSKLTEENAREALRRCRAGERSSVVAKHFGVSTTAINLIVKGRNWSHLQSEPPRARQSADELSAK